MTNAPPPPPETPQAAPSGATRPPSSTLDGFQLRGAVAVVERRRIPALVMLLELAAGERVAGPDEYLREEVVTRAAAALRRHGVDDAGRELAQRVSQANARELAAAVAAVEGEGGR